jgi:hypothetical protein
MPRADVLSVSAVVVEPWEIHSELVLVSPEVCARARELLPLRDPDAFLTSPLTVVDAQPGGEPSLPIALAGYTVLRLAETARSAFFVLAVVAALACLAQLVH